MLRQVAQAGAPLLRVPLRAFSTAPSVYDKLVQLTIVDGEGRRHIVRGTVGQSVVDVLEGHMETLGDESVCLSPEGRGVREAHVKLPNELMGAFPPHTGDDARFLEEIAEPRSLDSHSRLGSKVVLSKELDGTVIALGQLYPWKSLARAAALACAAAALLAWAALPTLASTASWRALRDVDSEFDWGEAPPPALNFLIESLAAWLPRLQARLLPPHINVALLATGFAPSKALYALTKLGVADELAGGTMSAAELAQRRGVKEDELRRLLRAVSAFGIFAEVSPGVFANNRGSSVLRSNHPSSCNAMVQVWGDESYWGHEKLFESLQPGSPPSFHLQSGGVPYFEWLGQPGNKGRLHIFHTAMVKAAAAMNAATLQDYPWQRHANETLSDVGGGHGGFLADLLHSQPSMWGVLVDLPSVVADAAKLWRQQHPSLMARVKMVPADFFGQQLPQADVHFLRYVLHDWSDPQARQILQGVHAAIPAGTEHRTTVLIQDVVLPASAPPGPLHAALDLQMLSIAGGKERSRREWEALLDSAGFRLVRVHRLRTLTSVIEAQAVAQERA